MTPTTDPHEQPHRDLADLIESRIGIHDSNQFEVKLDYTIDPLAERNRYHIEAYFFIPRSLGINPQTYSRESFYGDVQGYIRFKTPVVALGSLVSPSNRRSPLTKIQEALDAVRLNPEDKLRAQQLDYELRLLACMVRANVRDQVTDIAAHLRRGRGQEQPALPVVVDDLRHRCDRLLADVDEVVAKVRQLRTVFAEPSLPAWLREVFACVDEYLSIMIESHLTLLVEDLDAPPSLRTSVLESRTRLCAAVAREQDYRRDAGFVTILGNGEPERYTYRRGWLKKFVMSVLFLEISKEREGRGLADFVAAMAAGVAMLFAAITSIASQQRWGLNSLPFLAALVLSYILKDRIKDWLKLYFSSKMTRFLADYDVRIQDPFTGATVGRCREAFSFIERQQVPTAVFACRHADAVSVVESANKPELVMKYEKDVRFSGSRIGELHGRLHDINDIIRFNISDFLGRADDPVQAVHTYDLATDAVRSVDFPKVYHVNVVFVLKAHGAAGPGHLQRVRVVLDKRGIRRLDKFAR